MKMGFCLQCLSRSRFITAPRTLFNKIHSPGEHLRIFPPDLLVFYLCCAWGFRFVGREGIDQERLIPRTEFLLVLYSQDTF